MKNVSEHKPFHLSQPKKCVNMDNKDIYRVQGYEIYAIFKKNIMAFNIPDLSEIRNSECTATRCLTLLLYAAILPSIMPKGNAAKR